MDLINLPNETKEITAGCCDPNGTCHCSNPECQLGCNPSCTPNTACPPIDILCPFGEVNK